METHVAEDDRVHGARGVVDGGHVQRREAGACDTARYREGGTITVIT